jgi:hypothetical protein
MYRKIGGVAPVALALVLAAPAAAAVAASSDEYTMNLRKSSATVKAGGLASTLITFTEKPKLEDTRVRLSATGLPAGVTARFLPAKPFLDGSSIMFLTTSSSTPAGPAAITITAITISSDPIGTTAPFSLTVTG